eukprot:9658871-Ditylum_brightwellii.AAC.1
MSELLLPYKNMTNYSKLYKLVLKYTDSDSFAKPTIKVNNMTVVTEMLAVYVMKSHARMAQEIMERIALQSNKYLNVVKFVPASLVMDKTI